MKIKPVFAWYDMWFGFYWSRTTSTLYCMIPFIGIAIKFDRPVDKDKCLQILKRGLR